MEYIDQTECPNCNSDNTTMEYDHMYEHGITERHCADCGKMYKVKWIITPIKKEKM